MPIHIEHAGEGVDLEERNPLYAGPRAELGGVVLKMAPALYVWVLEYNEAIEAVTRGELLPSAFGQVRLDLIHKSLRRNYPNLPRAWVDENVDIQNIDVLQNQALGVVVPATGEAPAESL